MAKAVYEIGGVVVKRREMSTMALLVQIVMDGEESVKEACEALGVSRNMLALWRKGKCRPYGKSLRKLADFTGVPIETIQESIAKTGG